MITDSYPHEEKPYLTTFFHEHAKVLSRIGEVKVITLIRTNRFGHRKYKWEDIEVEAFEMPYRPGKGSLFLPIAIALHFLNSFKNLLFSFKPDAVIIQMALPHGIGFIPLSIFKRPILIEHSSSAIKKNLFLHRLAGRIAHRRLSVSTFFKKRLEETWNMKFHGVVPNPIDDSLQCNSILYSGKITGKVIFVGRLDENKSPHLFVYAAESLPKFEFHLVGPSISSNYSRTLLLSMPENVRYHGALPRKTVLEKICESDIFVSTSKFETSGFAIAEALSLGKPVVWTDSGGPGDFLNEKNSVMVKERTPEAVAEAIKEAYEKLKSGYFNPEEIRKGILEYAGYDRVEKIYREVLNVL